MRKIYINSLVVLGQLQSHWGTWQTVQMSQMARKYCQQKHKICSNRKKTKKKQTKYCALLAECVELNKTFARPIWCSERPVAFICIVHWCDGKRDRAKVYSHNDQHRIRKICYNTLYCDDGKLIIWLLGVRVSFACFKVPVCYRIVVLLFGEIWCACDVVTKRTKWDETFSFSKLVSSAAPAANNHRRWPRRHGQCCRKRKTEISSHYYYVLVGFIFHLCVCRCQSVGRHENIFSQHKFPWIILYLFISVFIPSEITEYGRRSTHSTWSHKKKKNPTTDATSIRQRTDWKCATEKQRARDENDFSKMNISLRCPYLWPVDYCCYV